MQIRMIKRGVYGKEKMLRKNKKSEGEMVEYCETFMCEKMKGNKV